MMRAAPVECVRACPNCHILYIRQSDLLRLTPKDEGLTRAAGALRRQLHERGSRAGRERESTVPAGANERRRITRCVSEDAPEGC